jgi:hypothetical protein
MSESLSLEHILGPLEQPGVQLLGPSNNITPARTSSKTMNFFVDQDIDSVDRDASSPAQTRANSKSEANAAKRAADDRKEMEGAVS